MGIFLSEDGTAFTEAYATDINVLNATRVPLGYKFARKAKVVMSQPHPIHARVHGHSVYGISTMAFTAARLQTVVEACSAGGAELLQRTVVPQPQAQQLRSVQTKVARRSETGSEIVDDVEEQNGVDAQSVKLLLEAARGAILLTRGH